ncbi:MAG: hypothetical protein ACYTXC_21145 [Nostoc sp.]
MVSLREACLRHATRTPRANAYSKSGIIEYWILDINGRKSDVWASGESKIISRSGATQLQSYWN